MRLVYIYHSGFALEADGFSILIDYFKDSDPDPAKGYVRSELLKRAGTLYILASHFHPDHFHPEVLKWKEQKPDIKYIFSKDILKRRRAKADDAIYLKKEMCIRDSSSNIGNSSRYQRKVTMFGLFGRADYSYKGKYLATFTIRRDASSKFGSKNRWGNFPSASLGWRMSDEKFMEPTRKWLDDFKLRAGYGRCV